MVDDPDDDDALFLEDIVRDLRGEGFDVKMTTGSEMDRQRIIAAVKLPGVTDVEIDRSSAAELLNETPSSSTNSTND